MRNRAGIIQAIVKPENEKYDIACSVKNEYVIKLSGTIVQRESKNAIKYFFIITPLSIIDYKAYGVALSWKESEEIRQ